MNANKQDAGGLPELPKPGHYDDYEGEWYWTGSQMRAYGELCRAAPAGGDVPDARDEQEYDDELCFPEHEVEAMKLEAVQDSAPAGSGEVDEDIDGLCRSLEFMAEHSDSVGFNSDAECLRTATALLRKLQQGADSEMAAIGKLIRTQDNRITESPIFAVEQKREYVTDADYNDSRIVWVNDEGGKADAKEDADLEARYRRDYEEPRGWRRLAVFDVWEFVTACFTEQGCKDYIAANGHNLKETRIFAHGSYRNREWQAVRSHLIAASQGQEGGNDA